MSKYRIRMDAWVEDDTGLSGILRAMEALMSKLTHIKGERAHISYHKCYHEEGESCPEETVIWESK